MFLTRFGELGREFLLLFSNDTPGLFPVGLVRDWSLFEGGAAIIDSDGSVQY